MFSTSPFRSIIFLLLAATFFSFSNPEKSKAQGRIVHDHSLDIVVHTTPETTHGGIVRRAAEQILKDEYNGWVRAHHSLDAPKINVNVLEGKEYKYYEPNKNNAKDSRDKFQDWVGRQGDECVEGCIHILLVREFDDDVVSYSTGSRTYRPGKIPAIIVNKNNEKHGNLSVSSPNKAIKATILHEIGHVLGSDHEYGGFFTNSSSASVMLFLYGGPLSTYSQAPESSFQYTDKQERIGGGCEDKRGNPSGIHKLTNVYTWCSLSKFEETISEYENAKSRICDPPDLCFRHGRQEVDIVQEAGSVQPPDLASVEVEVRAFGAAVDNVTYGVFGTEDGEVLAARRIGSTDQAQISSILRSNIDPGTELYFQVVAVIAEAQARLAFDPSKETSVKVGEVVTNGDTDQGNDEDDTNRDEGEDKEEPEGSVNEPPKPGIEGPSKVNRGQGATFDGEGSSDPDGSITNYHWTVTQEGDGIVKISADQSFGMTFSEYGNYEVELTVTDDDGAERTATKHFTVVPGDTPPGGGKDENTPPTARIEGPSEVTKGQGATFDGGGSSDPDGSIEEYSWTLTREGDGKVATGDGRTFGQTFTEYGNYEVSLIVTDDDGATSSASKDFTVTLR